MAGSLDLIGAQLMANLHRCTMMMEFLESKQGKGIGSKIIEFAKNCRFYNI